MLQLVIDSNDVANDVSDGNIRNTWLPATAAATDLWYTQLRKHQERRRMKSVATPHSLSLSHSEHRFTAPWRKDVVNQCLEFVSLSHSHSQHRFPAPSSQEKDVVNQCLKFQCVAVCCWLCDDYGHWSQYWESRLMTDTGDGAAVTERARWITVNCSDRQSMSEWCLTARVQVLSLTKDRIYRALHDTTLGLSRDQYYSDGG